MTMILLKIDAVDVTAADAGRRSAAGPRLLGQSLDALGVELQHAVDRLERGDVKEILDVDRQGVGWLGHRLRLPPTPSLRTDGDIPQRALGNETSKTFLYHIRHYCQIASDSATGSSK